MEAICVSNLSFAYDKKMILEDLSVDIPKGKITIIIGPNGCGKSTLLKNIARIHRPKSGKVSLLDRDIKNMTNKEIARNMAVLPQSPSTPSGLLVRELVSFGRYPYQKPLGGLTKEDTEIVNWAMEKTGVLELANCQVDMLSGGQRQRVWIAMAIAQQSPVLLLDEPTTYLDIAHQLEVLELLKDLNNEKGYSIVIVLHELNLACRYAQHIIGMKAGKVVFEGNPNDVITEEHLKELYGIDVKLGYNEEYGYPICVDYQLNEV